LKPAPMVFRDLEMQEVHSLICVAQGTGRGCCHSNFMKNISSEYILFVSFCKEMVKETSEESSSSVVMRFRVAERRFK